MKCGSPGAELTAAAHIQTQVAIIRTCAPFVPIAFATERTPIIAEACLPTGVHVVSADDLELRRIVNAGEARRREQSWEARNGRLLISP